MCGIAGFYGRGDIRRMSRLLSHRGPDGEGIYEGPRVSFGARSLKIVNPTGPNQPFFNGDRSVCVALNGEIYNYPELQAELPDHRFETDTDTETIAHAYEAWGLDCVERFNGCFAFSIWDGETLHLVRDRLGQKPLYYLRVGDELFFASEVKAIVSQVPCAAHLSEAFRVFETPVGEETMFEGIRALPRASILSFDGRKLSIRRYWQVDPEARCDMSQAQAVDELRALLEDSVRLRVRGRVPSGVFLSGGIDSGLIAALAKPELAYTCHFAMPGRSTLELDIAREVAAHVGARHVVIEPTPEDFREEFESMVWHMDQPVATAAAMPFFMLARRAGEDVRVILSGEGSDEIFNGYIRHLLLHVEHTLGEQPELAAYHPLARMFWHPEMFGPPSSRYFALSRRGRPDSDGPERFLRGLFDAQRDPLCGMAAVDIDVTLPSLLMMADRACSAFAVENRSPFLDHRIVEFAFSLPPELKIRDMRTKFLLREACRGLLPDRLVDRRDKEGLLTPLSGWLQHELLDFQQGLVARADKNGLRLGDGAPARGAFDRSTYMRMSLGMWYSLFIERQGLGETLREPTRGDLAA